MTLFAADTTSENGPADGIRWAILRLEGDSAGELQASGPRALRSLQRRDRPERCLIDCCVGWFVVAVVQDVGRRHSDLHLRAFGEGDALHQ